MKEIISSEFEKMAKIPREELEPSNPFPICNESVGTEKTKKRERCIQHIKDQNREENSCTKGKDGNEEGLEDTKDLQGPPREFNAIPYKKQVARDEQFGDKFTPQKRRPLIPKKEITSPKKEHADFLRLFWKGEEVPSVQANTNYRWVITHKAKTVCSCSK